ncbi:uncharacterized protein E0L32_011969 [Thyridium curvatum]|uniref:Uncharacterized protein n=1 Tax=Thyridium curvatum TaxID=1093900 RepID=A0A507BMH4_9PEZI|nr:uncharacterized protein E0L32_011969 [Thyridium curvatum]TPX17968.1 hypothetical protein E0L32_011969 [Thyridium curvatum]
MHRPALRALLGRRPELLRATTGQASCQTAGRRLSTTASLRADEHTTGGPTPAKPTSRQRSAAAASQLGALGNSGKPDAPAASAGVDARSLGGTGGLTATNKIINVRSLPRPRGGNGNGNGNRNPPGPSGVSSPGGRFVTQQPGGPNAISAQRPGARGGPGGRARAGAGAGAGRGGPGGRRPGGGPGGAARGRRPRRKRDDGPGGRDSKAGGGKLVFTAEEQKWLDGVQQGVAAPYTPSLTLESLVGHGPATASAAAAPLSQLETALRGMRLVAGGEAFSADVRNPAQTQARLAEQAESQRPVFFHDAAERAAFGKDLLRDKPSEGVQKAILQNMFAGTYAQPQFAAAATDTLATARNYHDRDCTYQPEDSKAFEDKVRSLLPKQQPAAAAAAAAAAGKSKGKGKNA